MVRTPTSTRMWRTGSEPQLPVKTIETAPIWEAKTRLPPDICNVRTDVRARPRAHARMRASARSLPAQ